MMMQTLFLAPMKTWDAKQFNNSSVRLETRQIVIANDADMNGWSI